MYKELLAHEKFIGKFVKNELPNIKNLNQLLAYNYSKILIFQHERLIHLIVTISFALFLLLSILSAIFIAKIILGILSLLILILLIPYIIHYYRLENGVQRLYKLHDQLKMAKLLQ